MASKTLLRTGFGVLAAGAFVFGNAAAAHAADLGPGHTDVTSIRCNAFGSVTVDTYREDIGHFNAAGDTFVYDDSDAAADALTYNAGVWTASGEEIYEDAIPFLGFQYESAAGSSCPSQISIDATKANGGANSGDATFTANDSVAGGTSSATGDTTKVKLWKPPPGSGQVSHEHGAWTFTGGTASGADYTLTFTVRNAATSAVLGSVGPIRIHIQP